MKSKQTNRSRHQRYVLSGIAPLLSPAAIAAFFSALAKEAFDIEQIATPIPGRTLKVFLSTGEPIDTRQVTDRIAAAVRPWPLDVVLQTAAAHRTLKRLLFIDMDSTLVQVEGIDELAKEAGVGARVVEITHRAMNGELSFKEALRERVRLLSGLPVSALAAVWRRTVLTPGARELVRALKSRGCKVIVLSGGFDYFVSRVQKKLGLDGGYANRLAVSGGRLTGEVVGDIVDGQKKLALMKAVVRREGVSFAETIAIGDGANDLPMIGRAGLGIAFCAKPNVRAQAPCNITQPTLAAVLDLLGIPAGSGRSSG